MCFPQKKTATDLHSWLSNAPNDDASNDNALSNSIGLLTQDVSQLDRMEVVSNFIKGNIHILIATDVVGVHGINVAVVILVDLPIRITDNSINMDVFMRRVGRCRRRKMISLVKPDDGLLYNISAQFQAKRVNDNFI